ncbi:MAG: TlpA family protein disulfide reductase [Campylobacteraceae bacterium]|nr:TlpA family protein disulfide reductase [Campylobacteraceae bacterium]
MLMRLSILTFLSLFFLSGCEENSTTSFSDLENETVVTKKSKKEETLTLKTLDGDTISISKTKTGVDFSGHEGKVVLLNFFATWCPPCKAEIPHLNSLQAKHQQNLSIISVALEDIGLNDLIAFREFYDIQYLITYGEENYILSDLLGGVQAIPYMVLYDKKGNYATHYDGAVPEEMIDADILKNLAK